LNLPGVATRADNKIIGKATRGFVEFEDGDIVRLFLLGGCNGVHDLPLQFGFLSHEFQFQFQFQDLGRIR
jgi:hypothetical protein